MTQLQIWRKNSKIHLHVHRRMAGTYNTKWVSQRRRFEIGFHPILHGLLFGSAKLSSNISFDIFPPSQNPTSFATISALSCICLGSWGSVQSLLTKCSLLCFPSSGTSHLMNNESLSSAVKRELNLFARNSLSRFNALILQVRTKMN